MIIILLLPLIPICIYIAKTKTQEEIKAMNQGTKRAAVDAAAAVAGGLAIAIRDGDK